MLDRLSASLAANLRRFREARGLTQQQLSEASGVPRPTLAHLETGSANPTLSVLARVAQALTVSMEQLVSESEAAFDFHAAESLVQHEVGGVLRTELCPDAPGALSVERLELSPRAHFERSAGRQLDRAYLSCEKGEVDVRAVGEQRLLQAGDVLAIRRGTAYTVGNRGRSLAVVYAIRLAVS
jgi:transcriptional regulator with XRE-family HTH domain